MSTRCCRIFTRHETSCWFYVSQCGPAANVKPAGEYPDATSASARNRDGAPRNHCPPVTALFKGRRRILERLDAYFGPRPTGPYRRREFLLHGMGGSGKSQIALKFAEMCEQRSVPSLEEHFFLHLSMKGQEISYPCCTSPVANFPL